MTLVIEWTCPICETINICGYDCEKCGNKQPTPEELKRTNKIGMSTKQAIYYIETLVNNVYTSELYKQSGRMAIQALKEKQQREQGCTWCRTNEDIAIANGLIKDIYCSHCGRRLGDSDDE